MALPLLIPVKEQHCGDEVFGDRRFILYWEVLPHPPYSPDLAQVDFHLYTSLTEHLGRKDFHMDDDVSQEVLKWFRMVSTRIIICQNTEVCGMAE